jgi:hypothetical protein
MASQKTAGKSRYIGTHRYRKVVQAVDSKSTAPKACRFDSDRRHPLKNQGHQQLTFIATISRGGVRVITGVSAAKLGRPGACMSALSMRLFFLLVFVRLRRHHHHRIGRA